MKNYKLYSRTEKSRNVRHKVNQDRYIVSEFLFLNDETVKIMVVADGVSGSSEGEKAAENAVTGFAGAMYRNALENYLNDVPENFLISHHLNMLQESVIAAIQTANQTVCDQAAPFMDTGTTISTAVVLGDCAVIANVGDSPVYFYRRETEELVLVSKLQTVAEENVEAGKYERYSLEYYENAHIICSSLGSRGTLVPGEDIFVNKIENIKTGDMLLIGSDGAFGRMGEKDIREILSQYEDNGNFALKKMFARARVDKHDDQTAILFVKGGEELLRE